MLVKRRPAVLVVAALGALGTGCGEGDSRADGAPVGPLGAPPATPRITRPLEPGDPGFVPVTAVSAGEVEEACPDSLTNGVHDGGSAMAGEASRLEPMLGVVLQYGQYHTDVFGGYGLHWSEPGNASVLTSFTDDVAEHRAALAELVEFPDELIVCQAPASEADRIAIQATLVDELAGRFISISAGGLSARVTVDLNPTEATLAAELVERYGAAIDVHVGALAYPLSDAEVVCAPAGEVGMLDGLELSLVGSVGAVTSAGTVAATIRVANTSDQPIHFSSGLPALDVTDADGSPLTKDTRGRPDVGLAIDLEPGAHQDFDVEISLASCDPALGYLIPPGQHFVVVSLYNSELGGPMHSEPLRIEITN